MSGVEKGFGDALASLLKCTTNVTVATSRYAKHKDTGNMQNIQLANVK